MESKPRFLWLAVLALAAVWLSLSAVEATADEDLVALGRRIYTQGRAEAGAEIIARVGGDDGVDVPAWTLPCLTCHGRDGRGGLPGQEEAPPDIRWRTLKRSHVTAGGRQRPAYPDDKAIRRAISEGLDAGDQELSMVMPRYRLSEDQWLALVAYLESM